MKNTISDLWNGNIAPYECCGACDPAINELIALIERNREALNVGLTDTQREVFQKYIDCFDEYLLRMLELAFCDGFSLGSRLVVEALQKR